MKPRVFLPAILSAVLLWVAYFPLDLGPVAFVALVPWLTLVRAPDAKLRYLAAYTGGFVFFALATNWVRVAHPMMYLSWLGLALACPVFWVVGLWLLRRIDRLGFVPLALSVPLVWIGLEYARAHFPTGYPMLKSIGMYQMVGFGWYFLGYTQHAVLPLIQVADLGGVYMVSFLVAAVNGLACDWVLRSPAVRRCLRWSTEPTPQTLAAAGDEGSQSPPPPSLARERVGRLGLIISSVAVVAVLGSSLAYGYVRLNHPEFTPGPRVAAIQGSVAQGEKIQKGESLGKTYGRLHLEAQDQKPRPDLIVWPETCFPEDWFEIAPGQHPPDDARQKAASIVAEFGSSRPTSPVLLGLNGLEWEDGRVWKYNSALLLDTRGRKLARYDKMHLVPFGEYVPFKDTLPWMSTFSPYKHDYSCRPGEHWTRFTITGANGRPYTFGCLICYEDSDPYLARQYAGTEHPADFLVNISNDAWFDGTEEHQEHLAICRFRAVEARRPVVRAVNMGISAVIDADGRIVALPADTWDHSVKTEGVVCATVPLDTRTSWYARFGDWLPAGCWALVVAGVVAARFRK